MLYTEDISVKKEKKRVQKFRCYLRLHREDSTFSISGSGTSVARSQAGVSYYPGLFYEIDFETIAL